jgi:hypothetical protein
MRFDHEVVRDGPRIRVVLPDVLPPDWDGIERELRSEIEDGATQILVCAAAFNGRDEADDRLITLLQLFAGEGIDTVAVWGDCSIFAPQVSVM